MNPLLTRLRRSLGFTLIELLVVLAIIAVLLTIATPRYFHSLEAGKEEVLRHDLTEMRRAIDQFAADRGALPENLDQLAQEHYLVRIPPDPITESDKTWIVENAPDGTTPGVYDVHSGADGTSLSGVSFSAM